MVTKRILTVADLHQRRCLYEQLADAVEQHRPDVLALVGDFLNIWQHGGDYLSVEECSRRLNELPVADIICVRGNHEDANWIDFIPGRIQSLNGSAFQTGPLVIVGFPCLLGDESWFLEGGRAASPDAAKWFPPIAGSYGPAARTLWMMHEPPLGTLLSMTHGPLAGNVEWRDAIENYSPLAVVFGHDHQTPWRSGYWHDRIGDSICFNAGQTSSSLYYLIVEAMFSSGELSLPKALTVTHCPTEKQIRLR